MKKLCAFVISTQDVMVHLLITITAATPRPIQLRFRQAPSFVELRCKQESPQYVLRKCARAVAGIDDVEA
jgi:hypothetical protein